MTHLKNLALTATSLLAMLFSLSFEAECLAQTRSVKNQHTEFQKVPEPDGISDSQRRVTCSHRHERLARAA